MKCDFFPSWTDSMCFGLFPLNYSMCSGSCPLFHKPRCWSFFSVNYVLLFCLATKSQVFCLAAPSSIIQNLGPFLAYPITPGLSGFWSVEPTYFTGLFSRSSNLETQKGKNSKPKLINNRWPWWPRKWPLNLSSLGGCFFKSVHIIILC